MNGLPLVVEYDMHVVTTHKYFLSELRVCKIITSTEILMFTFAFHVLN